VPNQLAGKSLEDIITGWQQELEKHSQAFVGQARLLAAWDGAVLANRHALLDVEQELRAVHAGQDALERQLDMIETHQKVGATTTRHRHLLHAGCWVLCSYAGFLLAVQALRCCAT
jgi:hypothetical protein